MGKIFKNQVEPHRHFIALGAFFYLIVGTYAYVTDFKSIPIPGIRFSKNLNVSILEIDNIQDWLWTTFYTLLFYLSKFALVGYIMEVTHPAPKTEFRVKMTKKQQRMGFIALIVVVLFTTTYMWLVEPMMPYRNFYATNELTWTRFFISLAVYMFCFDTWFWMTHMMVHHPFLMKHLHSHHHQFIETSAFGQDAVHPLEALIQGPFGHYLGAFIYPIHPVCHVVFGLLTSMFALAAHDGRFDPNFHMSHHYYQDCNFGLFWGFWDYIFGTRYNKQKYPIEYIPSWIREAKIKYESQLQNDKVTKTDKKKTA